MRVGRGPLERQSTRVIIKVGGEEWASHQILEVCVFESVHADRTAVRYSCCCYDGYTAGIRLLTEAHNLVT